KELPLTFLKGEYHMWFLFLILGLYLLIPILRKLTASKKNTACFLLITGVLFFLIPRAVHLLALFGISVPLQDIILSAMNINVVSFCYLFVFVLGHYLHQYDLSKVWRCVFYIVGMVGFAATVGLTLWHSRAIGSASGSFYTYMSLNVMAMAVALFVFGKYHFRNESLHFRVVSRYSFGIYLSHVLFIDLLSPIGVTPWTLPLISVAVFCLSLGLSALLHRIPVLKKYIV
ncbi:MAG: acyltransferase family protein, partial [Clostridia bacterium]|nr:acyltransferase family protein [Clostridia bacterium]